jgi:flagellin-like hook-associated protein FlgL
MLRLSSGKHQYRRDDAAVADCRQPARQHYALNQAGRNANDGIGVSQVLTAPCEI